MNKKITITAYLGLFLHLKNIFKANDNVVNTISMTSYDESVFDS